MINFFTEPRCDPILSVPVKLVPHKPFVFIHTPEGPRWDDEAPDMIVNKKVAAPLPPRERLKKALAKNRRRLCRSETCCIHGRKR